MAHSDNAVRAVKALWTKFTAIYGHRWLSQFIDNDFTLSEWCSAIKGLTPKQVGQGLEKCKSVYREFPPNCLQFRDICIDADGRREELYNELLNWENLSKDQKSREGLYLIRNIDRVNFRRADYKTAERMFRTVYEKMLAYLADGNELPDFPVEIEHKKEPPLAPEKISALLGDILKEI